MLKAIAFLVAGVVAALAVSALWRGEPGALGDSSSRDSAALVGRIAALESKLRDEQRERAELEDRVAALQDTIAALPAAAEIVETERLATAADEAADDVTDDAAGEPGAGSRRAQRRFGPRGFPEDDAALVARFIEAGITPDRAQWITDRMAELRMQALQAQYDAAREGRSPDPAALTSTREALREELGTSDYEKYLEALGRPTDVAVREVIPSSPAEQAGLLPGDRVVAYGGQRVFDMADLNRLTLEGQPGQTVAVDVVRDGQQIQLYIPRGPMGISGGFGPRAGPR